MSPIEITASTPNWKGLEGTVLEGGYELRELLEADASSASFRVRVLGDYSQRASATFYTADGDAEKEQVAIWDTLRQFKNQRLNAPVGTGVMIIADVPTEYLVLPVPDEVLSNVLQHRNLTEEEVRELMNSLVPALELLHANGFVHGRVSPERIVSVGNSIQLTTIGVRRINALPPVNVPAGKYLAPESVEQDMTVAADVWGLGATLLEALAKIEYAPGTDLTGLPLSAGFRRVIEGCLETDPHERCGLSELSHLYRQAPLRPRRVQASATAEPVRSAVTPVAPANPPEGPKAVALGAAAAAGPAALVPAPPMESPTLPAVETGTQPHAPTAYDGPILVHRRPTEARTPEKTEPRRPGRAWLYSGIGVLVLFAIFLIFRIGLSTKQPTVARNGGAAASSTADQNHWPTRTLAPDNAAGKTAATVPAPAATKSNVAPADMTHNHGSIWRVILYTYAREADAQNKAEALNQKHAGLGAEVFSPSGNGELYLVVAGGKMTRDEAVQMRRTVLRMGGMPHDTYVENFDH